MASAEAHPQRWRGRRAAAGLALLACAALAGWRVASSAGDPPTAAARPIAIPVDLATASRADVPVYVTGLGTVQAFNKVTVSARVDGALDAILFQEGQTVQAGEVLARIDPRPLQAALDGAVAKKAEDEAALADAKLDLGRFSQLAGRNFASKQQLDSQAAKVDQLAAQVRGDQAAIDTAATQLDYATIRASFAGRTGRRLIDQGNLVRAADPQGIVTIVQLRPISVLFTLPERLVRDVNRAVAAGPVPAWALGDDDRTVLAQGSLALVDNEIDAATGTVRLKATFANDDGALWPGQFVNLRLLARTVRDATTVPADAVQRGQQGLYVYAVGDDGRAEARPVTVGPITDGVAVVEGGLAVGERVVAAGQSRLQPGARVEPSATARPVHPAAS